ncbi:MAG: histidine--tRNA ligase [Pseudonocardiaceae bacterium]
MVVFDQKIMEEELSMTRLVRPQTLRGFRDLLPEEMLLRNEVIDRVRRVYESYGYVPLDTPILELLPTLVGTGGEEADKQIFQLETPEKQPIGMRFDLTVPFARVVAQYSPHEIKLPFRRYHIGPVFRADEPHVEQGRFRQFVQFDVDIAGTTSIAADAEIVAVMSSALKSLDLSPVSSESDRGYFIRVNNRRLLDAFLAGIGVDDEGRARHVLRVLDKRDKISDNDLIAELGAGRVDRSGDPISGVGLDADTIKAILDFVSVEGSSRAEVVGALADRIAPGDLAHIALAEVNELLAHLEGLGVEESAARFDPSLARGLAYYTGTVYEGTLSQAGVGSVIGGGRYDGLVSRFRDESVPAVGASIGLDRLITGLRNLKVDLGTTRTAAQVLVLMMPKVEPALASTAAAQLRAAGIATELYVGDAVGKVGRQLAYANAQGFDVAIILGASEIQNNTVTIKDLREGLAARGDIMDNEQFRSAGSAGQSTHPREQLTQRVAELLLGSRS